MVRRALLIVLGSFVWLTAAGCGSNPGCPTCPGPIPIPQPPPPDPTPEPPPPPPPPVLAITKIMAFGDSLTEGESTGTFRLFPAHDPGTPGKVTSYPAQLHELLKARYTGQTIQVFNGGFGGRRATEDTGRFVDYLRTYRPELVILMHGANDLNGGAPIAEPITAVETMISDARSRGIDLFLSTLPRQREGGKRAFAVELVPVYNEELADSAKDRGVPLIDIYPQISLEMLTPDGLHITPEGNLKLAQIYFEAIKARYERPPAS